MYKFSSLCSGFASNAGTISGKSKVNMSTPVHAVATPLNTCRASRTCFDERVEPCCLTSATQHVTTFSCAEMHGLDSVSCLIEFGLNCVSPQREKIIALTTAVKEQIFPDQRNPVALP